MAGDDASKGLWLGHALQLGFVPNPFAFHSQESTALAVREDVRLVGSHQLRLR